MEVAIADHVWEIEELVGLLAQNWYHAIDEMASIHPPKDLFRGLGSGHNLDANGGLPRGARYKIVADSGPHVGHQLSIDAARNSFFDIWRRRQFHVHVGRYWDVCQRGDCLRLGMGIFSRSTEKTARNFKPPHNQMRGLFDGFGR
jgi:hypothetical protein